MKSFKDFNIKPDKHGFVGDKIKIDRLLNREIIVNDYRIEDSKYEGKGKCLHMQITIGETKQVVFHGSKSLMNMIEQVPKDQFPFKTIVIKENGRYEFS